jgi:DNA-binding transcriptional MerR regulator
MEETLELSIRVRQELLTFCIGFVVLGWTPAAGVGDHRWVERARAETAGVYSIGAVAKMVGVSAQTLRAWEDRYAQIVPTRSAGGRRLYSRDDVEQLRVIREHIESGLHPADAHRLLAEDRRTRLSELDPDGDGAAGVGRGGRTAAAGNPGERWVILLAERDPYAAEIAEFFLRTEGYVPRIVLDVADAERAMLNDPPHLLVIDLLISGGAGLAFCRATRQRSPVPIVAVSALASGDAAVESGADAFLQKPVDPLQFVSTVRDLLGTSAFLRRQGSLR